MNQWISVEDRLPEINKDLDLPHYWESEVVWVHENGDILMARYVPDDMNNGPWMGIEKESWETSYPRLCGVTHWIAIDRPKWEGLNELDE